MASLYSGLAFVVVHLPRDTSSSGSICIVSRNYPSTIVGTRSFEASISHAAFHGSMAKIGDLYLTPKRTFTQVIESDRLDFRLNLGGLR